MAQSASVRSDRLLGDVKRFYELLDLLEETVGGKRRLAECDGRMDWPRRGVYFFFEPGETRSTSGAGPRVVRVGTHGLKAGKDTKLWDRLRTHRGTLTGQNPGGGNHRGSIFRLHVGTALLARGDWPNEVARTWHVGSSAKREIREREVPLEKAVSEYIGQMPFLWLAVDDSPGLNSLRGYLERNAIALLSNSGPGGHDPPSPTWLGRWAAADAIRSSGLWNVNHVGDGYDPGFLDALQHLVTGQ